MTDLRETSDLEPKAEIDTAGWVFVAFVVVITAIAAMVAYEGNNGTMIANTPASHIAGAPG
jgi:hypothetical protein